jgi:pyruvate-ferredoxin/flavodoxin oxidoreductase
MSKSMSHQKDAVRSGYWPLYRFHPSEIDDQPFKLDSHTPSIPVRDFAATETRYAILERTDPARARELSRLLQADVDERWRYYEQLAAIHRAVPHVDPEDPGPDGTAEAARDAGDGDETEGLA